MHDLGIKCWGTSCSLLRGIGRIIEVNLGIESIPSTDRDQWSLAMIERTMYLEKLKARTKLIYPVVHIKLDTGEGKQLILPTQNSAK